VLSADGIGPNFNPDTQITHVRLGEGPFKVIVLKYRAGFDFDAQRILAATVHVEYGNRSGSSEPLHVASIRLTKDQPQGQVQFFADDQGTQSYRYSVEFVFDAEHLVGAVDPQSGIRSAVFENETRRDITVDLERHSPVIPVTLRTGHLDFDAQVLRQVQVRVAPTAETEGRTIKLDAPNQTGQINVLPVAGRRGYFMSQTFFFRDDSTQIDVDDAKDSEVFINEPDGVVFRMRPQFVDPYGLVDRMLTDLVYRHADGEEERATLQLDSERPSSESAVVLREDDPRSWSAIYRFVMKDGPPLTGPRLEFDIAQPFANLTTARFRVVKVDLLDPAIFVPGDVLAVRVVLGVDPDDTTLPSATVMLRQGSTASSVVVPGAGLGQPVEARIDVIRRGVAPERSNATLSASEDSLFLFF
jgi:hypothetical protein